MYPVIYTIEAKKDLKTLPEDVSKRIIKKIAFYAEQAELKPFCKPLQGFENKYRFRVGVYRVIFRVDSSGEIQILMILRIKHRKDIYDL